MQSQNAVSAHFKSERILPFDFAEHCLGVVSQQTRAIEPMLGQCCPPSTTSAQHRPNVGSMSRVCWNGPVSTLCTRARISPLNSHFLGMLACYVTAISFQINVFVN